jgi:hypothetical protein
MAKFVTLRDGYGSTQLVAPDEVSRGAICVFLLKGKSWSNKSLHLCTSVHTSYQIFYPLLRTCMIPKQSFNTHVFKLSSVSE